MSKMEYEIKLYEMRRKRYYDAMRRQRIAGIAAILVGTILLLFQFDLIAPVLLIVGGIWALVSNELLSQEPSDFNGEDEEP